VALVLAAPHDIAGFFVRTNSAHFFLRQHLLHGHVRFVFVAPAGGSSSRPVLYHFAIIFVVVVGSSPPPLVLDPRHVATRAAPGTALCGGDDGRRDSRRQRLPQLIRHGRIVTLALLFTTVGRRHRRWSNELHYAFI